MTKWIALIFWTLALSIQSHAAALLNTQCTKNRAYLGGEIQGLNIHKSYTIASVSKVLTTHWAVTRLGPKFRYPTVVNITPVSNGQFDVHLQGGLYPYFDKTMLQFLVGQLNLLGINKVHFLTYDQNFLYSTNIRTNPTLAHGDDDVSLIEIMKDLRKDTTEINVGLVNLNAKALAIENLVLPAELNWTVTDIHYLEKEEFEATAQTVSYYLYSTELYRNLKEMNRNSNNFVAEKLFAKLHAQEEYSDFVRGRIPSLTSDEIGIYNGSGYPVMIGSQKTYNSASCAVVVEVMDDLRALLKLSGLDSQDVMPVAGKDSVADGDSTVTQIYGSPLSTGALIGKTGSVADTIALAGLVSTENEDVFFQTSFAIENTDDRATAYGKIKFWLEDQLLKDKKKGALDKYQPKTFMSFDSGSKLQRINPLKLHKY